MSVPYKRPRADEPDTPVRANRWSATEIEDEIARSCRPKSCAVCRLSAARLKSSGFLPSPRSPGAHCSEQQAIETTDRGCRNPLSAKLKCRLARTPGRQEF